ncbi:regulator of Vps4 activity in the MVB pathway protein isoform X3 [Carex rostrata]
MAANEIIELFCELIVARLSIITRERGCPVDLKEGISSLIYAGPRCSELPELLRIHDIFEKKYGRDFVTAATELRPDSGVNRHLIEKLSVKKPTGDMKLKVMKAIAKEYQVDWDTTETEQELLKPPEERLVGPTTFVSASTLPITTNQPLQADPQHLEHNMRNSSYDDDEEENDSTTMEFSDTASAAQAAAEFAAKAVSAANSAAQLSKQESSQSHQTSFKSTTNRFSSHSFDGLNPIENEDSDAAAQLSKQESSQSHQTSFKSTTNRFSSHSFDGLNPIENEDSDADSEEVDSRRVLRSNTNVGVGPKRVNSDVKFDDSDGFQSDEDMEKVKVGPPCKAPPPKRAPPPLPKDASEENDKHSEGSKGSGSTGSRVHPKLPDYEELTARYEALRSSGSFKSHQ